MGSHAVYNHFYAPEVPPEPNCGAVCVPFFFGSGECLSNQLVLGRTLNCLNYGSAEGLPNQIVLDRTLNCPGGLGTCDHRKVQAQPVHPGWTLNCPLAGKSIPARRGLAHPILSQEWAKINRPSLVKQFQRREEWWFPSYPTNGLRHPPPLAPHP